MLVRAIAVPTPASACTNRSHLVYSCLNRQVANTSTPGLPKNNCRFSGSEHGDVISLIATKRIRVDDEILVDYGADYQKRLKADNAAAEYTEPIPPSIRNGIRPQCANCQKTFLNDKNYIQHFTWFNSPCNIMKKAEI